MSATVGTQGGTARFGMQGIIGAFEIFGGVVVSKP